MANPNIKLYARKGALAANAAKREAKLTPEQRMPPLDSADNAKTRLDVCQRLLLRQEIDAPTASAINRGVEIWLKAEAYDVDVKRLKELERLVSDLEAELKRART